MLTFKDHDPIINLDKHFIEIWNDERECYEKHSFEFIEDLAEMIKDANIEALAR